jgi:hypothetical protein
MRPLCRIELVGAIFLQPERIFAHHSELNGSLITLLGIEWMRSADV